MTKFMMIDIKILVLEMQIFTLSGNLSLKNAMVSTLLRKGNTSKLTKL